MGDRPRQKSMTLSIHGNQAAGLPSHFVDVEVFNRKLRALITALKAADRVANLRRGVHSFYVSRLETGSAIVEVTERPAATLPFIPFSSVDTVVNVAKAIEAGDFSARANEELAKAIRNVAKGASNKFSYIELRDDIEKPVRIDRLFEIRAERFFDLTVLKQSAVLALPATIEAEKLFAPPLFFAGASHDAFDGTLKEVDVRPEHWTGKFVLTGSKREIDCVFKGPSLEDVQKYLDVRVWAEGLAVYTAQSGLPERLEIHRVRPMNTTSDLRRWRGKVQASTSEGGDAVDWTDQ